MVPCSYHPSVKILADPALAPLQAPHQIADSSELTIFPLISFLLALKYFRFSRFWP